MGLDMASTGLTGAPGARLDTGISTQDQNAASASLSAYVASPGGLSALSDPQDSFSRMTSADPAWKQTAFRAYKDAALTQEAVARAMQRDAAKKAAATPVNNLQTAQSDIAVPVQASPAPSYAPQRIYTNGADTLQLSNQAQATSYGVTAPAQA